MTFNAYCQVVGWGGGGIWKGRRTLLSHGSLAPCQDNHEQNPYYWAWRINLLKHILEIPFSTWSSTKSRSFGIEVENRISKSVRLAIRNPPQTGKSSQSSHHIYRRKVTKFSLWWLRERGEGGGWMGKRFFCYWREERLTWMLETITGYWRTT